jgi:PEP-CTERM motif
MQKRTLLLITALPLLCCAETICPPTLAVDGETVAPSCPGLGAEVIDEPGANYQVWFEDLYGGGDRDYNDIVFSVDFDSQGIPTATFIGADSSYTDLVLFKGGVLFSKLSSPGPITLGGESFGQELEFSILTPVGGFITDGPGFRNPDGEIHAYVVSPDTVSTTVSKTPEPQTFLLLGGGLLAITAALRRRAALLTRG